MTQNSFRWVPTDQTKCPYCDKRLFIQSLPSLVLDEEQDEWLVETIELECEAQPDDFDSDEFEALSEAFNAEHSNMPYVYWLPAEEKVIKWLNLPEQKELRKNLGVPQS